MAGNRLPSVKRSWYAGRMKAKSLYMQAQAHLNARFDRLSNKFPESFPGTLTRQQYVFVNMNASMENIRNGLVPDGKGEYIGKHE